MNPSERLTINQVQNHDWLSNGRDIPTTPLMTPGILGRGQKRTFIESALNTYNAFHKAAREGFALQAVEQAPLAKRRKQKKTTSEERRSTNCSSEGSSCCDINDNRKFPEELP